MNELKACPFCGGKAKIEHYDTDGYLAMCSVSDCYGMVEKWFRTETEAINAWNRRVKIPAEKLMADYVEEYNTEQ